MTPSGHPADVMCWSGTRGWVANRQELLTTTDAGASWGTVEASPRLDAMGRSVVGCSGSTAWVSESFGAGTRQWSYQVLRTLDGGGAWQAVLAGNMGDGREPSDDFYDGPVAAPSEHGAVLTGSCPGCGRILVTVTSDGGRTFQHHHVTTESDPGDWPMAVTFPDPDHGWILGRSGTVYATTDGGVTWTRQLQSPLLVPDYG